MVKFISYALFGFLLAHNWACRSASGDADKVAEVDGAVITRAELDRSGGKPLTNLRQQLYNMERQKLDEFIGATLLTREAKNKGVSVTTLLEQEVNGKAGPVSEPEIEAFYNQNKARIPYPIEKVHDEIRDYLREQKVEAQKNDYLKALRAKAKVTSYLKAPPVVRVELSITGAPVRGSEKAKVTIVKFEEFQCPYCKAVQPTLKELLKRYDGKIRLVHKDLPLDQIHPRARPAAEAARCAGEQGKFWDFHDMLYANGAKLTDEEFKSAAKEVGLDTDSFDKCLASGKFKGAVQKDLLEGAKLGLNGTPAFFINGRELTGAQPLEAFAAVIDEELAQAR
jgi:protein-disulfide isomerase